MPRYFFQVSGAATHDDGQGYDLPDIDAAWSLAVESTGELLCDLDGSLPDNAEILTTVSDADGTLLIKLAFKANRVVVP